ncbi:antibiotic biosynthesis monooxygenase family protein [Pseudonocardia xinjiangensis]|uniref:antibiotic biosynthesis monooxygenase family protein n=1 Tax=Pseudonocardia xinjiangensis TaxID=75289 RepID=UPI003D8D5AFE
MSATGDGGRSRSSRWAQARPGAMVVIVVLEIADFAVLPGTGDDFASAVREGNALVADVRGFHSARLGRCVETPGRFVLMVEWESLEAHTAFRESEKFVRRRELIGPFLAGAPRTDRVAEVPLSV